MTDLATTKLNQAREEAGIEPYVRYSSVVAPGVVMCREGEMIATWRVAGVPFETAGEKMLETASVQVNTLFRQLNKPELAVQIHRVRRHVRDSLSKTHQGIFIDYVNNSYNAAVGEHALMATELYVTLIMRKVSMLGGVANNRIRTEREIETELRERLTVFENTTSLLERSLKSYGLNRLGEYTNEDGAVCSHQLSFYNYLLTGFWQPVRVPSCPIWQMLGNAFVYAGNDILELQSTEGRRFAQVVELKDYASSTTSGIFDQLLYPDRSMKPYEFIESQTFCFLSPVDAKKVLKDQQKLLLASEDDSVSQIRMISLALEGITNGDYGLGQYSYVLTVFGESEKVCRANTRDAKTQLANTGFMPFTGTLAAVAGFFSMSPCNFRLRPRIANLTTKNLAHMAPLHSFFPGKRDGNPWGEAVCLMMTPSDQPYYFNFHVSSFGENSFDKKLLANTMIIGMSGAGKTVLANFLLACMQKFRTPAHRLSCVYFDKDRGAEIAIRAMGGGYLTMENGKPTGFNPFALPDTPENRFFLEQLLKMLLGHKSNPLSAQEEIRLSKAIGSMMILPPELRRLSQLTSFLIEGTTQVEIDNSMSKRLAKWIGNGSLAWVFDNPVDELNFDRHDIFGIDGSEFLDNAEICSPVTFYLLYRMESIIDGRRFFFVMDEFWKYLQDPEVGEYVKNKMKTIRKQNGFAVFATQEPNDVINSPIASSLIQQTGTFIFLPNTKASREEYVKFFKITDSEFNIIAGLTPESRAMLIKQGNTQTLSATAAQSAVCKLDLGFMSDALPILSGSTDNVAILDSVRARYGDRPEDWLKPFLEEVKRKKL